MIYFVMSFILKGLNKILPKSEIIFEIQFNNCNHRTYCTMVTNQLNASCLYNVQCVCLIYDMRWEFSSQNLYSKSSTWVNKDANIYCFNKYS